MSAHALLNLLNELRKRDNLSNEFNSIEQERMLDDIKIILKSYFCRENVRVLPYA